MNNKNGWRKSSFCGSGPTCVEVRPSAGGVAVRDGKHPAGPVLEFNREEWAAFMSGARNGEFDLA